MTNAVPEVPLPARMGSSRLSNHAVRHTSAPLPAQGFTTGERIVWSELLFDISRAGFKDTEIARKVGVAPTTINGLKNGAWIEPKYSLGAALIELHHKLQEAGKIKRPHDR